jgi:hypothetical protein
VVTRQAMSAFMRRVSLLLVPPDPNAVPSASVVLLGTNPTALSGREQQWLTDLRADLGEVDALAYSQATASRLTLYFTVFVIDTSASLDVGALATAYDQGRTVNLIGPAATYQAQVAGTP